MNSLVRLATAKDAVSIAAVQVQSWRTTYRGIVPDAFLDGMTVDSLAEMWAGQLEQSDVVMYIADGEDGVFGFACGGPLREAVGEYDAEMYAIYLLQEAQHKGVGRELTWRFCTELKMRGFQSLLVWVLEENPSMGFYQRLQGVEVTRKVIGIAGKELVELAFGWPTLEFFAYSTSELKRSDLRGLKSGL